MSKKSKHHKPKGPRHPPQNTAQKAATPVPQEQKKEIEPPKPETVAVPPVEATPPPVPVEIKPQQEPVTVKPEIQEEKRDDQPPVKPKRHRNRKKKHGDNNQQGDAEENSPEPEKTEDKEVKPVSIEKVEIKEAAQPPEKPVREKVESGIQCSKKNVDDQKTAEQKQANTEHNKKRDKNIKEDKKSESEPEKMPDIITTTTPQQADKNVEVTKSPEDTNEQKQNKNKKGKNKKGKDADKDAPADTKKEDISPIVITEEIEKPKPIDSPKEAAVKDVLPKAVIEELKEVQKKTEIEEKKDDFASKQSEELSKQSQKDKKSGKKGNEQKDHETHAKSDNVPCETPIDTENKQPVEIKESPKSDEKSNEDLMDKMATSIEETLKKLIVCESDSLYGEQLLEKDKLAQEEKKEQHEHKSKSKKQHKHKEEVQIVKDQGQHQIEEKIDKNTSTKHETIGIVEYSKENKKGENVACVLSKEESVKSEDKKDDKNIDESKIIIVNLEECKMKKEDIHTEDDEHDKKHKKGKKNKKDNKNHERTDSPLLETKHTDLPKNIEAMKVESLKTVPDDIIQALLSDDPPKFIDESEKCSIKETKSEKDKITKDESKHGECKKEKQESKQAECKKEKKEKHAESKIEKDDSKHVESKKEKQETKHIESKVEKDEVKQTECKKEKQESKQTESKIERDESKQIECKKEKDESKHTECKKEKQESKQTECKKDSKHTESKKEKEELKHTECKIEKDESKSVESKKEKDECEKKPEDVCCKLTGTTPKIETENIHKKQKQQKGKHGKHEKESIDSASPAAIPTEDKHIEKRVSQILEEKPTDSSPKETEKIVPIAETKIEEKISEEHLQDKNLEISKTDEAALRCSPKPAKRGKDKKHKHDKSTEAVKSSDQTQSSESSKSDQAHSSEGSKTTEHPKKDSSEKTDKAQKDTSSEKDKTKSESKDSESSPTSEENFEFISLSNTASEKETLKPDEQPRERSPLRQNSKNLHGPSDIPVKSSKNDFKKERNKTPNHCDASKNLSDITDLPQDPGKCKNKDSSGVIITEEACSTTLDDDEDTEFVYKYSFRVVYIPNACQVCKVQLNDERVVCQFCHLVGYCFEKHRDEDWSQHQSLCYAICTLTHVKALEHIYADAKGLNGQDYRLLRMQAIVSCEKLLKRKLCPWEQEVLLYPRICQTSSCREWRSELLKDCGKCGQISYCIVSPEHLDENHKEWCNAYALYHALVNHQLTKGRIEPILPSRIINTDYLLPEKCSKLLEDLYGCVINMDECHYATLTQLSTAPLTALFSYQKAAAADKNTVKSMKDTFCIHVIGAELQFEADTPNKWEVFFLHMVPELKELKIVFIGPELNVSKLPVELLTKIRMCPQCRFANRRVKFEFHDEMLYHDFVETEQFSAPDLICAFNPGFHRLTGYAGLDTWPDTIKSAMRLRVPLCCTAYTSAEAPRDLSRILECCGGPSAVRCLMEPKKNPYRSRRPDRNFVSDDDAPLIFKNYYVSLVTAA